MSHNSSICNGDLYSHCIELGLIIGQRWSEKGAHSHRSGTVAGITLDEYVILDPSPKACGYHRIPIQYFPQQFQLIRPVHLHPYKQVDGSVRIQVLALDWDGKPYPFGELRNRYETPINYDYLLFL